MSKDSPKKRGVLRRFGSCVGKVIGGYILLGVVVTALTSIVGYEPLPEDAFRRTGSPAETTQRKPDPAPEKAPVEPGETPEEVLAYLHSGYGPYVPNAEQKFGEAIDYLIDNTTETDREFVADIIVKFQEMASEKGKYESPTLVEAAEWLVDATPKDSSTSLPEIAGALSLLIKKGR